LEFTSSSSYLSLLTAPPYHNHGSPSYGYVTGLPSGFNIPQLRKGQNPIESTEDIFYRGVVDEFARRDGKMPFRPPILISSQVDQSNSKIYPYSDSFVRGAIEALGQHQHLVIRPEEVWFPILIQMNYYMNAHANDAEFRQIFVNHEGKQEMVIVDDSWYEAISQFRFEMQKRVKTDWILDWMTPNFTLTTESDRMTANILMMGLMQAYFGYTAGVTCGLSSVTLLGTSRDWEILLTKLDRLKDFGKEPADYGKRLRPFLSRFV
jgi:hypothetical protein